MKKLTFFVLALIATIGINAQTLDDWTIDSGIDVSQSTDVHSGTYSALVTVNTGTQSNCDFDNNTVIPVTEGSSFTVSFYYKTSAHVKGRIHYYWVGASAAYGGYTDADISTWTEFTESGTVPAGATAVSIGIRFYDQSGFTAGEEQYIDDLTFESPTGTSLTVTNGDMESWSGGSSNPTIVNAITLTADTLGIAYSGGLSSVDASSYTLLDGTTPITFGFAAPINLDQDTVLLSSPSRTIIGDAVLDTLVDGSVTDSFAFYAGILPIAYTNSANASVIQNGYNFTVKALVTANDNYNNVWIKDNDGAFGGAMVYNSSFDGDVAVGDSILVVFQRDEYNGLTEFVSPLLIDVINSGNTVPVVTIAGADIDTNITENTLPAEQWEGQIVEIDSVTITETGNYYFYGETPDGSVIKIGDNVDYQFGNISMNVGTTYNIIGVVDYNNGYYRLNPRSQDDIAELAPSGSNTLDFAIGLPDNQVAAIYTDTLDTINAAFYLLRQGNGVDVTFSAFIFPDPTDSSVVLLDGADNAIANDNMVDTLFDLYNNTSFEFYAGVLPVSMTNNASSEQVDDSHFATYTGIVTANDNYNQVWIQDGPGGMNGLLLYVNSNADADLLATQVGDSIYVAGIKGYYNGMTELLNGIRIPIVDTPDIAGHQVYAAQVDPSHLDYNLTQDTAIAEIWEGQLVKLNGIVIDSLDANYQYYGHTCDGAMVAFNDDVDYHYGSGFTMDAGSTYNVTGVVTFSYGHYLINPRDVNDAETVTFVGSEVQEPANQTPGDSIMISEHSDVANAFEVARFVIADQGGDGLPTVVSNFTILAGDDNTVSFVDELDGGFILTDDGNLVEFDDEPVVTANTIDFSFMLDSMLIPDGETKEFVAYVWLDIDTAVNGHVLQFKINSDNFSVFDATCASSPFVDNGTDIVSNQFVLYKPTAVDELANSVSVYPNPATSVVNISGDVASVELFNSLGQEISVELKDNSIDVNNLQAGVYFARIILANGEVVNTQIIKK